MGYKHTIREHMPRKVGLQWVIPLYTGEKVLPRGIIEKNPFTLVRSRGSGAHCKPNRVIAEGGLSQVMVWPK